MEWNGIAMEWNGVLWNGIVLEYNGNGVVVEWNGIVVEWNGMITKGKDHLYIPDEIVSHRPFTVCLKSPPLFGHNSQLCKKRESLSHSWTPRPWGVDLEFTDDDFKCSEHSH